MDSPPFPPQIKVFEWASYCADRRPQFKMHQHRGQAMNAITYTIRDGPRGGVAYHHENGEWVIVFIYEYSRMCVECGIEGELRRDDRREIGGFLSEVATSRPTRTGRRERIPKYLQKTVHYNCKELYKAKHPEEEWAWTPDTYPRSEVEITETS